MADESSDDKTEPATPKKISKAREDGKVLRSQEVTGAAMIAAAIVVLVVWMPLFFSEMRGLAWEVHGRAGTFSITVDTVPGYFQSALAWLARLLLPVMIPMAIVAWLANVSQVGFLFTGKPLSPKLETLNPISGIKRLVSWQGVSELIKSLLKVFAISMVGFLTLRSRFSDIVGLSGASTAHLLATVGSIALRLAINVALAIVVIAILDYAFQRWQFLRSLRMTKKEVQEETRQSEGDPHVRGRLRGLMRQVSRRRMMQDTATADVVVTNPVHVAVALRYAPGSDRAPIVVAKGMRRIAEKIKAIAREHEIPIVENPPLARQLHKVVEVGDMVPANLYKAVAEVLAFVFHLKQGRRRAVGDDR